MNNFQPGSLLYTVLPTSLCLGLGTSCIEASVTSGRVCYKETDIQVEPFVDEQVGLSGAGQALRTGVDFIPRETVPEVSLEVSFIHRGLDYYPGEAEGRGLDGSVGLLHIELVPREGLASFRTFDRVEVWVAPATPVGELPPTLVAICDRGSGCNLGEPKLRIVGDEAKDLMPYLETNRLEFLVIFEGQPPVWTWAFDVDVCMAIEGTYNYRI